MSEELPLSTPIPSPSPPLPLETMSSESGGEMLQVAVDRTNHVKLNDGNDDDGTSKAIAEAMEQALAAVTGTSKREESERGENDKDTSVDDEPVSDFDNNEDDEGERLELMNSKLTAYRLQVNDLDCQLLKAQSEASINSELEARARKRQLVLEKEVAECRAEIESLKNTKTIDSSNGGGRSSSSNMGPAFGATAELVVRMRAENNSLRSDLQRALEAAKVAAGVASKAAEQPGNKKSEDINALEYAMHRDEQMSKLTTKNFELFHQVEQRLEEVAMAEAKYENSRREIRKKRARIRDLHSMLKKERNRRVSAENENNKLKDKVASLTKHIEKLMSALRVQAHERSRRLEENRKEGQKTSKLKRKMKLTRNKGFLSERVIVQLRQQVEMLTGQLRLADDRFTELRSTLDMERRTNIALQKKSKRRMKSLQEQESLLSDHIASQKRMMEIRQAEVEKKQTIESKRLKRMQDKLEQERTEMLILKEASGFTGPSTDGRETKILPSMSFSPMRVEMYERDISTPPPSQEQRGSMLAFSSSLPNLPSPASQSSPFGLQAEAKARKIRERKDAMRKQREKNREKERRENELHFWREQEENV
jgi:hypothetical protein